MTTRRRFLTALGAVAVGLVVGQAPRRKISAKAPVAPLGFSLQEPRIVMMTHDEITVDLPADPDPGTVLKLLDQDGNIFEYLSKMSNRELQVSEDKVLRHHLTSSIEVRFSNLKWAVAS